MQHTKRQEFSSEKKINDLQSPMEIFDEYILYLEDPGDREPRMLRVQAMENIWNIAGQQVAASKPGWNIKQQPLDNGYESSKSTLQDPRPSAEM